MLKSIAGSLLGEKNANKVIQTAGALEIKTAFGWIGQFSNIGVADVEPASYDLIMECFHRWKSDSYKWNQIKYIFTTPNDFQTFVRLPIDKQAITIAALDNDNTSNSLVNLFGRLHSITDRFSHFINLTSQDTDDATYAQKLDIILNQNPLGNYSSINMHELEHFLLHPFEYLNTQAAAIDRQHHTAPHAQAAATNPQPYSATRAQAHIMDPRYYSVIHAQAPVIDPRIYSTPLSPSYVVEVPTSLRSNLIKGPQHAIVLGGHPAAARVSNEDEQSIVAASNPNAHAEADTNKIAEDEYEKLFKTGSAISSQDQLLQELSNRNALNTHGLDGRAESIAIGNTAVEQTRQGFAARIGDARNKKPDGQAK